MDLAFRFGIVAHRRARLFDHLAMDFQQRREIERREIAIERADEIVALVREQHAERGEMRGKQRHDDLRNVELARNRDHVQRARAARGDQREIAGIIALRDRHFAHRERHFGDGDVEDGLRGGDGVHPQRACDLVGNSATGALRIELHLAAQEIVRIKPAQHHIGIGNGRRAAAAAVTDGAGVRAGTLRSHLQRAHLVEPRD